MKEKDIHELIEQEELEAKARIWKKISAKLNLQKNTSQTLTDEKGSLSKDGKDTGFENNKLD